MLRFAVSRTSGVALLNQLWARHLHNTMRVLNATPFAMPAMSPTMEKGGIVEWKYKVGDKFSAGDVILEVETDKAQIDVEAQDDGKLAKIVVDAGAKDIPVGETIAYLAESDDDLATLKLPVETKKEPQQTANRQKESKESPKKEKGKKSVQDSKSGSSELLQKANPRQTLLPSVSQLLAERKISEDEAFDKIKGSGKEGRLLKGDVLAYLGLIPEDSVVKIAKYIKKSEGLDLSNITLKTEPLDKSPEEKTEKSAAKLAKPAPVILHEQLTLKAPNDVAYEQLERSLDSYVDEAYHFSHAQPLANTKSDFFDSIFEDLVTESPTEPRFKVEYQLIPLDAELSVNVQEDIFDLLSGSNKKEVMVKADDAPAREYILNVDVQLSDKFSDSKGKAERFINYLKQLEFV